MMAEPVFFLEHYVAFKIVHVFDELPFRHDLQLMLSIPVFHLSLCLSNPETERGGRHNYPQEFLSQYVNLKNVLFDMVHLKV